ncbi:hypothetical protein ABID16_004668 [Rhizobium aquaticum]|uniref:Uncharacterized protein n=1 Tax=Rhizobium aquaticum TaxID=1549636 RepID=A0ABV2J6C4_9HYPH
MNELDSRDSALMEQAYDNPQEAEDRMVAFREQNGENGLFVALRERPELFGDYPRDKALFDDAYNARKALPSNFDEYRKRRDESDEIQRTLQTIRRERGEPSPDDDFPQR